MPQPTLAPPAALDSSELAPPAPQQGAALLAPVPDAAPHCPNCGDAAPGAYCPQCGQSQRDRLRTSLPQLLGEGVKELLDTDSRTAFTLRRLLFRPGFLTVEYLAGRRVRYVRPVRLYLTASVLFFVVLSLKASIGSVGTTDRGVSTYGGVVRLEPGAARADSLATQAEVRGPADSTTATRTDTAATRRAGSAGGGFVSTRLTRFGSLSQEEKGRVMRDAMVRHLPKAFFALVPVFALLLKALYLRRGLHYAEHLILALHIHAFAFLVNAVRVALPEVVEQVVGPFVIGWLLVYAFLALRRVYGQSRRRTAAKLALLLPVYGVAILTALSALLFAAMLFT